ncbi:MAG: hypothetical protein AAF942_13440 [Pseudomonadota bacterium]
MANIGVNDSRIFRIAVALAVLLSMMLPPADHSASHFAGADGGHGFESHGTASAAIEGHDHSHHGEQSDDRDADHSDRQSNDHNPADHTHDIPAAPQFQTLAPAWNGGRVEAISPDNSHSSPSFRIRRPPRIAALT